MSVRWLMGLSLLFFMLSAVSGILEGLFITDSAVTTLYSVGAHFTSINFANPVFTTTLYELAVTLKLLLEAVWNMIWWNYSFFTGDFVVVRYFLMSISSVIFVYFMFEIFRLFKR